MLSYRTGACFCISSLSTAGSRRGQEIWNELKEDIDKESKAVIASLEKDMAGDRTDF